ncbi:MAG: hypothetical protein ACRC5M_01645 [Anaeroplasmataceae bacterium]
MIFNFLYKINEYEKNVITGIVEDDNETVYQSNQTFDLVLFEPTKRFDGSVVLNTRELFFCVFIDQDNNRKYLDVSINKDFKVEVKLTDKLIHAQPFSKAIINSILFNFNYFDYENIKYIDSGITMKFGKENDALSKVFKRLKQDSFVAILKDNKPMYLSVNEDVHCFTDNIKKAVKFKRNSVRKILVINEFVNLEFSHKNILFMPNKAIKSDNFFLCAEKGVYSISHINNSFTLKKYNEGDEIDITLENFNVVFDDDRELLIEIGSVFENEEESEELNYNNSKKIRVSVDSNYLAGNIQNSLYLVKNPEQAGNYTKKDYKIIQKIFKVFFLENKLGFHSLDDKFLNFNNNAYTFSSMPLDFAEKIISIKSELLNEYNILFSLDNLKPRKEGVILSKNGLYLIFNKKDNISFELKFSKSSVEATVFDYKQVENLLKILDFTLEKKELTNLIINNNYKNVNLSFSNKTINLKEEYKKIIELIQKKNDICTLNSNLLKTETERGALEFLRINFMKDVLDYKDIFSKMDLKNNSTILIASSKFYLELIGLSLYLTEKNICVNVSVLIDSKFGYNLNIPTLQSINVNGVYRCRFSNLNKLFLDEFDYFLFSKNFSEEFSDIKFNLNYLYESNKVLVTIRDCSKEKVIDPLRVFAKVKVVNYSRLFHKHDESIYQSIIQLNEELKYNYIKNTCLCMKSNCEIVSPLTSNNKSYYSIFKK